MGDHFTLQVYYLLKDDKYMKYLLLVLFVLLFSCTPESISNDEAIPAPTPSDTCNTDTIEIFFDPIGVEENTLFSGIYVTESITQELTSPKIQDIIESDHTYIKKIEMVSSKDFAFVDWVEIYVYVDGTKTRLAWAVVGGVSSTLAFRVDGGVDIKDAVGGESITYTSVARAKSPEGFVIIHPSITVVLFTCEETSS